MLEFRGGRKVIWLDVRFLGVCELGECFTLCAGLCLLVLVRVSNKF